MQTNLEIRFDADVEQIYWYDTVNDEYVDEVDVAPSDCALQELAVSNSGNWIVTERCSGQGEWGYDVLRAHPLEYMGGIPEQNGYMLGIPEFATDESCILGGFGEDWQGGWWTHPDDRLQHSPALAVAVCMQRSLLALKRHVRIC